MFRYIFLPGVIVIACAMGGFGFLLWSLFNVQFNSNWRPDQAYSGDIAAQRHLATCYTSGCAEFPRITLLPVHGGRSSQVRTKGQ